MRDKEVLKFTVGNDQYTYVGAAEEEDFDSHGANNVKVYHTVVDPAGKKQRMDWSPYQYPTEEDLVKWVNLGMPDRTFFNTNGPIDSEMMARTDRMDESEFPFLSSL